MEFRNDWFWYFMVFCFGLMFLCMNQGQGIFKNLP